MSAIKRPEDGWTQEKYDYIFLGTGASASLLLLSLNRNKLLHGARVLLVDQEKKTQNDKTFCFWSHSTEPINEHLQPLISHMWDKIMLPSLEIVPLAPLRYNHISSLSLYEEINRLAAAANWHKVYTQVNDILQDEDGPYFLINDVKIRGKHIFDSRTPAHQQPKINETHIYQSFIGWTIKTETEIKPADAFRFMDFQVEQQGFTQFVYALPFSSSNILVELTRFGAEIIHPAEAETLLEAYIRKNYGAYSILSKEQGCIPMSTSRINNEFVAGVTTLGARNYKIKPSTGYAFKNMYQHAEEITSAIKHKTGTNDLNQSHAKASTGRFAFYDSLLLNILKHRPRQGKPIFEALFKNVETAKILKFLYEQTNLKEDISIFVKLPWYPFLSALMRKTTNKASFRPFVLLLISLVLLLFGNETAAQTAVALPLFLGGLILVGIPHGAVDHLIDTGTWDSKKAPVFVLKYLLFTAIMGVFWYLFPAFALVTFLVYSAWHFGQADGKQWELPPYLSLLWGASVLYTILGTHPAETNNILNAMGQLELHLPYAIWTLLPWLLLALYNKQGSWIITIIWLLLSSQLPLLFAFGLYFIGQHSLNGWFHLKGHLKMSHQKIWLNALPFHAAAWLMLALFFLFWPTNAPDQEMSRWGIFFIFIACISLPHVVAMQTVYSRKSKKHNA